MFQSLFTPTGDLFLTLVSTFGCLSADQAALILGDRDKAKRTANHLLLKSVIREKDGLYTPASNPKPDSAMIDCIWVAMGKARLEDGTYDVDALKLAIQNKPVQIGIVCHNTFFNIVSINSANSASTLAFLSDRFNKGGKKETGVEYIFVVRNEDVIDEILSYEPELPYRIVLLEGNGENGPKLRYLKKAA